MNAKEKYQCDNCAKTYDEKGDAQTCCLPSVCTVWVCGKCNETKDDESDANECCTPAGEVMKEVVKTFAQIGPYMKAVKFSDTEYGVIENGEKVHSWFSKESMTSYIDLVEKGNFAKVTRL